jgi:hypothetical protein
MGQTWIIAGSMLRHCPYGMQDRFRRRWRGARLWMASAIAANTEIASISGRLADRLGPVDDLLAIGAV